jgi:hypothetical protein
MELLDWYLFRFLDQHAPDKTDDARHHDQKLTHIIEAEGQNHPEFLRDLARDDVNRKDRQQDARRPKQPAGNACSDILAVIHSSPLLSSHRSLWRLPNRLSLRAADT